jgi:aryl-alcohol dehydrogenase-like predicted oxidoreductase
MVGGQAITGLAWGSADLDESIAALKAAIDHGITTFDTAPLYGFGLSEELIGRVIGDRRNRLFIATKIGIRWDGVPGMLHMKVTFRGAERVAVRHSKAESIVWEVEQSLRRLGTDYIDLLQYHHPDPDTPLAESLTAMHQLVKQGKVRSLGVSNLSVDQIREVLEVGPIATTQNQYSLIQRRIESELVPFCVEQKIGVLAFMALARSILAGTTTPDRTFPPGDHRAGMPFFLPQNRRLINQAIDQIRPIAEDLDCTVSQLVLAWTLTRPAIRSVIVGIRTPEQAISLAKVERLELSHHVAESIDAAFCTILPHLEGYEPT